MQRRLSTSVWASCTSLVPRAERPDHHQLARHGDRVPGAHRPLRPQRLRDRRPDGGHPVTHYDVLVIGSGFGGSVTALRLSEKGYRVGVLEAGRRFADDESADLVVEGARLRLQPRARLLRPAPDDPAQGRPRADRRRGRWWLARLRQHPLRAAEVVLRGPALVGHHRLGRRAWRRTTTRRGGCWA
ncbi:NAD(P)-binding protein [Nocardioides convexus]|uniref:NAD(P)-binding protein n=1 Tax=Nocardioides convexus TaxID=2712224 RepID=UPI003100DE30